MAYGDVPSTARFDSGAERSCHHNTKAVYGPCNPGMRVRFALVAPVAGSLPADVGVAQIPTENDNDR